MDYEDYGDEIPREEQQDFLFNVIGFTGDGSGDYYVHQTFWEIMYNNDLSPQERSDLYDELSDRLYEEYGLDFTDLWDWEDFRSWYESTTG